MPVRTNKRDLTPTIDAARSWIDKCLIADTSVLSSGALWTAALLAEVRYAFVEHPDAGKASFVVKLKGQMKDASASSQQLMAEILWALLLFPSNIRADRKRQQVQEIWSLSGAPLDPANPMFSDDILRGIGSGGPGYNNHRWREVTFLIALAESIKERSSSERQKLFSDYDAFTDWIDTVPQQGHRQFRHMLRYFAFPERVERMSSNRDRRRILAAYGVSPESHTKKWTDRQLDEALQQIRSKLQAEQPKALLDFYEPPLRDKWSPPEEEDEEDENDVEGIVEGDQTTGDSLESATKANERPAGTRPQNLILYGPPGTGKTHWLRQKFDEYTDWPTEVDHNTWLQELVVTYGWRSVIAVALNEIGAPTRVPELRAHELIEAKAKQRLRASTTVQPALWANLQTHTPESVTAVKYSTRRPPFIFSKRETGEWELLPDWRELDEESATLEKLWKAGPSGSREPIRRYRVVTFHPSFSYEDFVRGIRPVASEADGTTQFRIVDGVFKRMSDEARANPSKRYALFIDEINRGNIAKVFGELISLIEPDKRIVVNDEGRVVAGLEVQLPGAADTESSEPAFGVPANLDIFGTMNTADRSIALLDVALRRRFAFKEMEPNYALLPRIVSGVDVGALLRRLNERLEFLLDRDHRIGHAYLMHATSLDDLRQAFLLQIIPLLQEFFFDDLSRVAAVLETDGDAPPLLRRQSLNHVDLFSSARPDNTPSERASYVVTPAATWTEHTFVGIYATKSAASNDADQD